MQNIKILKIRSKCLIYFHCYVFFGYVEFKVVRFPSFIFPAVLVPFYISSFAEFLLLVIS